jgi:hypothetical protein
MRKERTYPVPALPVLLEIPLSLKNFADIIKLGTLQFANGGSGVLSVVFLESGLIIKGIYLRGCSIHIKKNYTLRLRRKMSGLGCEGIVKDWRSTFSTQGREGDGTKAIGTPAKHITPVSWLMEEVVTVHGLYDLLKSYPIFYFAIKNLARDPI